MKKNLTCFLEKPRQNPWNNSNGIWGMIPAKVSNKIPWSNCQAMEKSLLISFIYTLDLCP